MKFFRSSKSQKLKDSFLPLVILVVAGSLTGLAAQQTLRVTNIANLGGPALIGESKTKKSGQSGSNDVLSSSTSRTAVKGPQMPPMTLPPPPPQALNFSHLNIVTTFFWIGEKANNDNGFIANNDSAWDEQWLEHYGGVDDPAKRSGYLPSGFTPQENPFYFALPYSDITDGGDRKATASNCPFYMAQKSQPHSWCKNSWLVIRHGGKVVYAQWEDAGPFGEDDLAYVFGSSKPANPEGDRAGLDVSPAVRDYLGLHDIDSCDWAFVSASSVPVGPWKQIITTTPGETVN